MFRTTDGLTRTQPSTIRIRSRNPNKKQRALRFASYTTTDTRCRKGGWCFFLFFSASLRLCVFFLFFVLNLHAEVECGCCVGWRETGCCTAGLRSPDGALHRDPFPSLRSGIHFFLFPLKPRVCAPFHSAPPGAIISRPLRGLFPLHHDRNLRPQAVSPGFRSFHVASPGVPCFHPLRGLVYWLTPLKPMAPPWANLRSPLPGLRGTRFDLGGWSKYQGSVFPGAPVTGQKSVGEGRELVFLRKQGCFRSRYATDF